MVAYETVRRLNIAMVVRQFSTAGGLELYCHKVVEGLLERGHKVTVLCGSTESRFDHPSLVVLPFDVPAARTKANRLKNLFEHASAAVKQHGPFDIVHSQHCPVSGADVVTFHNHTVERLSAVGLQGERLLNRIKCHFVPAYTLRHQFDQLLSQHAKCLIFPSEVMKCDYFDNFPLLSQNNKPYVVAHPGADLDIPPATDSAVEHSPHRDYSQFLFVGRGFRKKGLDILLQACQLLKRRKRTFKLKIAGLKARLPDKVRLQVMGLEQNVEYLGFCKNMEDVYSQSQVLILPSRVEPFGMAPLQAMQQGLVPVVSQVSGVSEVLTHEADSLLLRDHLSAAELAGHMERLMDDAGLRSKLSLRAGQTATKISWNLTVEQTLRAYAVASGTPLADRPITDESSCRNSGKLVTVLDQQE